MEILALTVVVAVLVVVQVRRRTSRLQRPEDPRAGLSGPTSEPDPEAPR